MTFKQKNSSAHLYIYARIYAHNVQTLVLRYTQLQKICQNTTNTSFLSKIFLYNQHYMI